MIRTVMTSILCIGSQTVVRTVAPDMSLFIAFVTSDWISSAVGVHVATLILTVLLVGVPRLLLITFLGLLLVKGLLLRSKPILLLKLLRRLLLVEWLLSILQAPIALNIALVPYAESRRCNCGP